MSSVFFLYGQHLAHLVHQIQTRPNAHAVSAVDGVAQSYDANADPSTLLRAGMTERVVDGVTYAQGWDQENRLVWASTGGVTTTFTYDANGALVKKVVDGETTVYVGNQTEKILSPELETKYYYFNSSRVAMRKAGVLQYIVGDHLGTTSVVLDDQGSVVAESRHYPYGEERWRWPQEGTFPTDYRFTGQRYDGYIKLTVMGARWYDGQIGRWISPDTIIPDPANPQSFDRYSYARDNPVKFTDPSGHAECAGSDCGMIFHPVSGNVVVIDPGGSALYLLIARIARGQASAEDRLLQVLRETQGVGQEDWPVADKILGAVTHTHFGGLGGIPGDVGFAQEFKDDHLYTDVWGFDGPSSKQTGHFLTAVDMGYREGWIHTIVAHELHSDSGGGILIQLGLPTSADIWNFQAAIEADANGQYGVRDAALSLVLNTEQRGPVAERQGNSMEDLRLSVRGWRLGAMVANGQIGTNKDLANWVALYVAGG